MGFGYSYVCRKCGHAYEVFSESGMLLHDVRKKALEDIAAGKYGPEWREAYERAPGASVDGSYEVYVCDTCGSWTSEVDITLCAPEKADGAVWDRAREQWVFREYRPACRKCGGNTHAASDDELRHLPCPVCGAPNEEQGGFLWD